MKHAILPLWMAIGSCIVLLAMFYCAVSVLLERSWQKRFPTWLTISCALLMIAALSVIGTIIVDAYTLIQ